MRSFDELTGSAAVVRVRDLKQALGISFYHPYILARIASYNAFFGKRFDELFRQAAGEIRSAAAAATSGPREVRGMVQDLASLRDEQVLRQDFGAAQEQFRKVAECTKALRASVGL